MTKGGSGESFQVLGFRNPAWGWVEIRSWEGGFSSSGSTKAPACVVPTALAEILSVKDISGRKLFYVHYIDCEFWARVR